MCKQQDREDQKGGVLPTIQDKTELNKGVIRVQTTQLMREGEAKKKVSTV